MAPKREPGVVDDIVLIINPEIFREYLHPGPLHEIEQLDRSQREEIASLRAKARQIIALVQKSAVSETETS